MVGRPRKRNRGATRQIYLLPRHLEWLESQGDGQYSASIQALIDKELAGADREAARHRMTSDPELAPYADHIFSAQWPDWQYRWIVTADKSAILDWIAGPQPEER